MKIDTVSETEWIRHYKSLWFDEIQPDNEVVQVDDIIRDKLQLVSICQKTGKREVVTE